MATSRQTYGACHEMKSQKRSTYTKLVVAAIDFGTTYSGYAYSFVSDYKKDPLKFFTQVWSSEEITTDKTPTCVLFNKDKNFSSFGYEAERKYAELAEEGEHNGWRFFKHFKMMLMPQEGRRLRRRKKLTDDQGQQMLAIDVFSKSIAYLKRTLLKHITDAVKDFRESDVHWVITVPAIWDDSAKQFMREAANNAGIDNGQLTLALEPEGAAIYCKEITVKRVEDRSTNSAALSSFSPGSQFLLLDLGGGTVDITVEKVEGDGTLSEIHHPNGGPWGGTRVDNAFKEFLINIFGKDVMQNFSENQKSDSLFLYRNFEALKRKTDRETIQKRILRIPSSLVKCATDASVVRTKIKNSPFNGKVELKPTQDKLSLEGGVLQDMFNFSSTNIVQHVRKLFTDDKIQRINTIILVGGFAESALITNDIRAAFPDKTIIVPQECSLAVLKGAVLYGHNPKSITSRKMPYTFGISTAVPFDNRCHPPHKKTIDCNGVEKCEDVFKVFFEIDKTVIPNETTAVHSFNCSNYSSTANVEIYRTKDKHPIFVSDRGCSRVGEVKLQLDNAYSGEQNVIEVTFMAGHTELQVQARHAATNKKIVASFRFLR